MNRPFIDKSFISSSERIVLNDYYRWLLELIDVDKYETNGSYSLLLKALHKTEFTWYIPNDDNRIGDGKFLRKRFADISDYEDEDYDILDGPCSVLEMLIGLADRCSFEVEDTDISFWFWTFIKNLGLINLNDELYASLSEYFEAAIYKLLHREYEYDGSNGGLFPLADPQKDQRKVEIWYQMQSYIIENYGF